MDTITYETDTSYVGFPVLLWSDDSCQLFYDRTSESFLFYSLPGHEVLGIEPLNGYIDRIQYPMGMYEIFALNSDSIYCFLYNNIFLIDRHKGVGEKMDIRFNYQEMEYLPETAFHGSAVNSEGRYAVVAMVPMISPTDIEYLDRKAMIYIDLKTGESEILPVRPPGIFRRGVYYGPTDRPRIKLWNNNLLVMYPVFSGLIIYDIIEDKIIHNPLSFKHTKLPKDFIPKDPEKEKRSYYYFKNSTVEGSFLDSDILYIIYRKGGIEQTSYNTSSSNGRTFIMAYDLTEMEIMADQNLTVDDEKVIPLGIMNDEFHFLLKEVGSDLLPEFKVIVYEMEF